MQTQAYGRRMYHKQNKAKETVPLNIKLKTSRVHLTNRKKIYSTLHTWLESGGEVIMKNKIIIPNNEKKINVEKI